MKKAPLPFRPTEDAIARRAQRLWDERGRPVGVDQEIWLEAERQLISENSAVATPPRTISAPRRDKIVADIDADEVADRLDDFGEPSRRSPTSANVT